MIPEKEWLDLLREVAIHFGPSTGTVWPHVLVLEKPDGKLLVNVVVDLSTRGVLGDGATPPSTVMTLLKAPPLARLGAPRAAFIGSGILATAEDESMAKSVLAGLAPLEMLDNETVVLVSWASRTGEAGEMVAGIDLENHKLKWRPPRNGAVISHGGYLDAIKAGLSA